MKANVKALALTWAAVWVAAVLLIGAANLIWPTYGVAFLQYVASFYPGYHANGSFVDLIVGVIYALVNGAAAGLLFGWLYNVLVGKKETPTS